MGLEATVLDGGLAKWKAEDRALASGSERYPAARFHARPNAGRRPDKDEVLRVIGDEAVCTINAFTAPVHAGTAELNYGRKGHIKGSVNVPYPSLLDASGTYRPAAEPRTAFDAVESPSKPRGIFLLWRRRHLGDDGRAGADADRPRQRGGVRRLDVGMGARRRATDGPGRLTPNCVLSRRRTRQRRRLRPSASAPAGPS
jgi:hypothetical protein